MQTQLSGKSAIFALIIVLTFVISWEIHLRHKGYSPDYDDGPELWSDKRAMVYEPADKAVVFIGSSRIKYDVDIPTWQKLTGTHAIQLAMVGSSPRHFLTDLADDPNFKGRLIVDVTEILFFSKGGNSSPDAGIAYYKKRTPAQKVSFILDKPVEASLAFLNSSQFSLNGLLNRVPVTNRPGVMPPLNFPFGFEYNTFDRQNRMTDAFVADTSQQHQVSGRWTMMMKSNRFPPLSGKAIDTIIQSVKHDVDKIKARGGDVIFTRTPSSGPFLMGEKMGYPRKAYWDKLLAVTGCKGIHFSDYPAIATFVCPEWSHLSPHDGVIYTQTLVSILEKEKGWKFNSTR